MRLAILSVLTAPMALLPKGLAADPNVPHLNHAFLIIPENHDYCPDPRRPGPGCPE